MERPVMEIFKGILLFFISSVLGFYFGIMVLGSSVKAKEFQGRLFVLELT